MKKLMKMMAVAALFATIVGCQHASQPGRTNSQVTTLSDGSELTVDTGEKVILPVVAVPSIPREGFTPLAFTQLKELLELQTNAQVAASRASYRKTTGDVFTQNMMIETGGNEANTPTATSTPSTSVPVNVAWGAGAIGGAQQAAGELDTMYLAFKKWWSDGGSKTATATTSTATTTTTSTPAAAAPTTAAAVAAGAACPGNNCTLPQ